MNSLTKEQLENLANRMYKVNSYISSHFVSRLSTPKHTDTDNLNVFIGNWIKEIREIITADELRVKENMRRKQLEGKYGKTRKRDAKATKNR